jgi:putative NIF3 family GTP cyclohydrolase 1 type 2
VGNYDECSFRVEGTGTFRGGKKSQPAVGTPGVSERVAETRLEMIFPAWRLASIIAALRSSHPYEEIAYDVVTLRNDVTGLGMGAVGELSKLESLGKFISRVKRICNVPSVRTNGNVKSAIRRVALVAGSGGSFLNDAIRAKADVFLTGDVRYHTFREAEGRLAIIDAGHAETECMVVEGITNIVRRLLRSAKLSHIRTVRASRNNLIIHV